jgi:hypothetical protein
MLVIKAKLKHTIKTKNAESILEAEYETVKQVDQSTQAIVSVSNNCSVVVNVVSIIIGIISIILANI